MLHTLGTDHFSTKDEAQKGQTGRAEAAARTASKQVCVSPCMGKGSERKDENTDLQSESYNPVAQRSAAAKISSYLQSLSLCLFHLSSVLKIQWINNLF